jgi:hypothetical protein
VENVPKHLLADVLLLLLLLLVVARLDVCVC